MPEGKKRPHYEEAFCLKAKNGRFAPSTLSHYGETFLPYVKVKKASVASLPQPCLMIITIVFRRDYLPIHIRQSIQYLQCKPCRVSFRIRVRVRVGVGVKVKHISTSMSKLGPGLHQPSRSQAITHNVRSQRPLQLYRKSADARINRQQQSFHSRC